MQVSNPLFFCLDAEQNLLISDYEAHDMKIFSKDGTHLHTGIQTFRDKTFRDGTFRDRHFVTRLFVTETFRDKTFRDRDIS